LRVLEKMARQRLNPRRGHRRSTLRRGAKRSNVTVGV
jgi:hypothetical protein